MKESEEGGRFEEEVGRRKEGRRDESEERERVEKGGRRMREG